LAFIALVIAVVWIYLSIQNTDVSTLAKLPPTCSPTSDCLAKLKAYGITISFAANPHDRGARPYSGDSAAKIQATYDTIALITQDPSKLGTLLKLPQKPLTFYFNDGDCSGHAYGVGDVAVNGNCLTDTNRFILTHELGHEIAFRNPDLINKFYSQFPFLFLSYPRGIMPPFVLPTFNCQMDYGWGPFPGECFADTVGEYPVYHTYRNTYTLFGVHLPIYVEQRSFMTFKTVYFNYYNFAKDNIYGGLAY